MNERPDARHEPRIPARGAVVAVALLGIGLALSACTRDQPPAPAPESALRTADGDADLRESSAQPITIVPATAELLNRAAAGGALISRLLAAARPAIGTPYVWGGTSMAKGIDCSNFTWLLYRSAGVPYARYIRTQEMATLQRNAGFTQTTFAEAQPGDLLVYGYRDASGAWHGHVVILVDKTGRSTGHPGLALGAHGTPVSAVQLVTYAGFDEGYFKAPNMRLLNVLRPTVQ